MVGYRQTLNQINLHIIVYYITDYTLKVITFPYDYVQKESILKFLLKQCHDNKKS